MKTIPRSPLHWVTSLYFAMGLPFVVLNMVSAVLFKDLGVTDARIAFWTSLIMWPWTIKFLWSPFLEFYRTKKFWVVATQFLSGVLFGLAALSLHLPSFFAVTVALFARDFRRGGVSAGLAFGGLLHRPTWSAADSFHAVLYLQPAVRGLRLACMVPAFEPVARGRWHRRGVLRLRIRIRGPHAVYDAAGRSGASPDGALRFRFGYHEPLGDAHGHGFRLFERSDELPDLLPRGDARHHSGFCDHPAGSIYL